ncbi:hypothetical protein RCL1_005354 [Eukaryota sp. TZLM3-RCL]
MTSFVRSKTLAETVSHWGCQPVERFRHDKQIGEGTYGQVFKGFEISTNLPIASKKIRTDFYKMQDSASHERRHDGFPITAVREISLLSQLRHPRIVNLMEVAVSNPERFFAGEGVAVIIFEYCEHDLAGLHSSSSTSSVFTPPLIRHIMHQLLQAISHCHEKKVIHRDIKMSNVLINSNGDLKLCDFGLARKLTKAQIQNKRPMTPKVVTRWYRPPEVFLGDTAYTFAVDMWSVGCIFAELLTGEAPFRSQTDAEAINKIWDLCGTLDPNTWPEATQFKQFRVFGGALPKKERRLRSHYKSIGENEFDLLDKMLQLNPSQRITAAQALSHAYFATESSAPSIRLAVEESHEFEVRKARKAGTSNLPPAPTAKRQRIIS